MVASVTMRRPRAGASDKGLRRWTSPSASMSWAGVMADGVAVAGHRGRFIAAARG
jgi:hypothetical protein